VSETNHYWLEVDVRSDLVKSLRSVDDLVDIVCAGLEARGIEESDYYVEVHGPPEVRIGVTLR